MEKYCRARQDTDDYGACALRAGRKGYNTHSEYLILTAVPLQQWLQERPSMLLYKYIACIVENELFPNTAVQLEQHSVDTECRYF